MVREAPDVDECIFQSSVLAQVRQQDLGRLAAVEIGDDDQARCSFSYGQLLSWAHEIASKISELAKDFQPEPFLLVALALERSALLLAAILGVWEAGGAYTPIPKDIPEARKAAMCMDATVVLSDQASLCLDGHPRIIVLSRLPERLMQDEFNTALPSPLAPCMVIYTSGSTGRPKGVVCNHRCLWHSVYCYSKDASVSRNSRLLCKTPYQWRTAEYELYPALCMGGTVYVPHDSVTRHVSQLAKAAEAFKIDALTTVPSMLGALMDALEGCDNSLCHVAAVGEPLPGHLCSGFISQQPKLTNLYGLTETGMTTWRCTRMPEGVNAPAGFPQPGVQVVIYQEEGKEGEIYFGGIMSEGYLNDSKMTSERYVEDLPTATGTRLFRTGDLGRWCSTGELEVLGRTDNQVKLNGIRVEPGEIEAVLVAYCKEAAVVPAKEDAKTLVAFVGGAAHSEKKLRDELSKRLPAYMLPLHILSLPELPRLPSGKVDRTGLIARSIGLTTRKEAEVQLQAGFASDELLRYVDSLGLERLVSRQRLEARRLWDNLMVLGMANVILFHWFWYVLVEPRTYLAPWNGHAFGDTVEMPKLPVAAWVQETFRIATQDWAYVVFLWAAVQDQSVQELTKLTRRDLAVVALYFYSGVLPMGLALLLPEPWSGYVFKAETIQRWFLLVLAVGKAYIVLSHRIGAGASVQMAALFIIFVSVPPCFADLHSVGGEYFLPTDWWPKCRSCLATPKELACLLLYVALAHYSPALLSKCQKTSSTAGLVTFFASCLLGSNVPWQASLEGSGSSDGMVAALERLLGLALMTLQAASLVCALTPLSRRLHMSRAARYMLGSYLFNLNFLDILFLPPSARRSLLDKLQIGNIFVSGVLTWFGMLLPVVFFMLVAAPVFQILFITLPVGLANWCWHTFLESCKLLQLRRQRKPLLTASAREPLLQTA